MSSTGTVHEYRPSEKPTASCTSCRRRKLRCDREPQGCRNCSKAELPCLYPPPEETSKRKRGPYQKDKTQRERELEHAVKAMEIKCEQLAGQVQNQSEGEGNTGSKYGLHEGIFMLPNGHKKATTGTNTPNRSAGHFPRGSSAAIEAGQSQMRLSPASTSPSDDRDLRLKNRFWSNFSNEFDQIKGMINEDNTTPGVGVATGLPSSNTSPQTGRHGFIFGLDAGPVSLQYLHPPSGQILEYWHIYATNVDPVTKIIHAPSFAGRLMAFKDNLQLLDSSMEALMFSIYFAAVTSTSAVEIQLRFSETKDTLLQRFKLAMEKALAKADFLSSRNIMTLQALVIYLLCLRNQDDSSMLWTLTGVAIRLAQLMDLPWDGSRFKLPPFETEMRRRLWWTICSIESRYAEENGFQPASSGNWSETHFPLNLDDEDLHPEATEPPQPRLGCTDMTFPLISFEIVNLISRVNNTHPPGARNGDSGGPDMDAIFQKKVEMVEECQTQLETKYLQYCSSSRPFDWMTVFFARLVLAKVRLIIYHPFDRMSTLQLTPKRKDEVFRASIEAMEYSHALKSEPRIDKWAWSFRNFVQWHALAYVLAELGYRSGNEDVDRAWRILDEVLRDWDSLYERNKYSTLWRPMNRLIIRARQVREADVNARTSDLQQARPPPQQARQPARPSPQQAQPTLQHLQVQPQPQMQTSGDFTMDSSDKLPNQPPDFAAISGTGDINPQNITTSPTDYFSALGFASKQMGAYNRQSFDSTYGTSLGNATSLGASLTTTDIPMLGDVGELPDASAPDFSYMDEFFSGLSAEDCANLARTTQLGLDTL